MAASVKCPKCGLVQMARPSCKGCGAVLGGPPPSPRAPSPPGARTTAGPKSVAKDAEASSSSSPRIATIGPGLLMGGVLVLGALLWLAIHWSRTPTQPTSVQPTPGGSTSVASPAKSLPKVRPRLSEAERRAASEALQALKALRSVTTAGVNYNEYSRRVLDAKIQVDRYTQGDGGNEEVKAKMRNAMTLYVFASEAWSLRIRRVEGSYLVFRPELELCPQLNDDMEAAVRRDREFSEEFHAGRDPEGDVRGRAIADSQPRLWQCASEGIAEIDQMLK